MRRVLVFITLASGIIGAGLYFNRQPSHEIIAGASPAGMPVSAPMVTSRPAQAIPAIPKARAGAGVASDLVFSNFLKWVAQFTNATASVVEGERLAWKRREALRELIETDPARALTLAVPYELRQSLPPQITKFFEEQVDGRGNLNVLVGTDFSSGHSDVFRNVELGDKKYDAFVYGRRHSQISQTSIPLHGIALDGKLALSAEPLRRLSVAEATALDKTAVKPADVICSVSGKAANWRNQPVYAESGGGVLHFCGADHYKLVNQQWAQAESGTAAAGDGTTIGTPSAVTDAWTHGNKSLLYIRLNFPDDLTEPLSEADAYAAMNGVNTFYTGNSYDLTSLTATVTPLITLPQTKAWYATAGPGALLDDARAAAKQAGFATANYDRDIAAFTSVPGFNFGGLAFVGGKGVWLQSYGVGVTSHELGHNYGLWHANFWNTITNVSGIGPGTNLEYGNIYDTMGPAAAGKALFNAVHKSKLDWLKSDAVQNITTNGVYRIYPFDIAGAQRVAGRYYAAAVSKDSQRSYWLEFRQQYTSNPWLENGVLLNWTPWDESNGGAHLIDTTPGSPNPSDTASREDAPVVVGRTFNDRESGVHITTLARGANGVDPYLDVQVNLGLFPSNQPPVLQVEVDGTNVAAGDIVHFHATATDPDGDALAYSWTFDDLSFSTNNLPWFARSFSTSGDHVLHCVVSDMKGGTASANVLVTVGAENGFRLSGRVTDSNGIPLEGVLVGNGELTAKKFLGGYTDSDGRYLIANINPTNIFKLSAFQFGYTFAPTTWVNPLNPTNDTTGIDFIATPLTAISITVDTNSIIESDTSAHIFTVTRMGDTNSDLNVNVIVAGTARPGADYNLSPDLSLTNVLTIPAGTNSVSFIFNSINDSLVEGTETATITLLSDDGNLNQPTYAIAPAAEATISILDDDATVKPVVTVTTETPEISEGGMDAGQLTFTRSGGTQSDLIVNYAVSGTATAGVDYQALPGVVLIPAGQSSTTIPLTVIDDKIIEPDETVITTISANAAYTIGSPAATQILIRDDDFMTVTIVPTSATAAEPTAPGAFTVKRDGDLTEALVVTYNVSGTASNGVDYATLSGTVTIPAGAASANISVTPIDDLLLEGDESVTLTLNNDFNYDVGTPGSATLLIRDNEKPTVTIAATIDTVSEQGDTTGQFTLTRNSSAGDLTVYLAISGTAASGIDYLPLDNPVVIPDGATSVTLDVIPFHDLYFEPTEDVVLTVLANSNYNVGAADTARVSITDDGTSTTVAVGFCFPTSAFTENLSPGIAVALSTTSAAPVTVDYRVVGGTAPGSRYSLPPGTLTISNGAYVGFIPLTINNDTVVEPAQTIKVVLFNPTGATLDGIRTHTYTILDDDTNSVSVTATAASAAEAGLVAGNFRITRTGPTNNSQLVNFQITGSASAPTDYAPLGSAVTIPAGATFVDLPVTPADDHTMEFSQNVVLTLISAPNGNIVSPNVATITISDNDTNTLPVVTLTSTNHPYALEGGASGEFLFTRTGPTTNALTLLFSVTGTAANGVDYATITNGVTIPAGQTSVIVPVAAVDDTIVEGDETVIVSLTQGSNYRVAYPATATVTIQDNDQRVWLDASDFTAAEPGTDTGEFTFSRFGTTNTPVTIAYTISGTASNGVDYVRITNSIVIPAGKLTATLPIVPLDDTLVEGPETVTLTLVSQPNYSFGAPVTATVVINDDEPMLTITALVTNVLEGSGSNGVFRLTRTGDPKYDFLAHVALGGAATFGVDYPPLSTNIFFACGITAIDLLITPTNEVAVEGDETVTAKILPDPAYTILSPSNAVLTIIDAGTNQTPLVTITNPAAHFVLLTGTNLSLVLNATVVDDSTNFTLAWVQLSGPTNFFFGSTNTTDTTATFGDVGVYRLRLIADDGQLQGRADITVVVETVDLALTNELHWTLDDGLGTNTLDSSGNGRDGTLVGAPIWTTNGIVNGALDFSGANDFVRQSAGSNLLTGWKSFTVALWIKPAIANADAGFVTCDDTNVNPTFSLSTHASATCGNAFNVIEATVPTTGGVLRRTSASGAVTPFQWQHVAVTWSNGLAPALYINGQLDQPLASFVAAAGVLTNCPQFLVGRGAADSPASWNGSLDDVRIFSRALSADEILALAEWPLTNHAPQVDAGPDVSVQLGVPVTLTGTVTDDGKPNPPATVTWAWTFQGTNNITVPDPTSLTNNTFTFTEPGTYTFRLTAFDGQLTTFDEVTVTVLEPTQVSVSASGDANELGPVSGQFTVTRNGDTNDMTVYLAVTGTASNGVDYITFTNVINFTGGTNSLTLDVVPILDDRIEGDESVILTVMTNIAYSVSGGPATVTIHDSPYGLWSIQQFTLEQLTFPNISGAAADFDHDGIANFAEYAFNLDPKAPNLTPGFGYGFEINTNTGKSQFTLTYTRRLPPTDVAYGVYLSTNLLTWDTGTNVVDEFLRNPDANGFTETVKVRATADYPTTNKLFMKINVWLQQVPVP